MIYDANLLFFPLSIAYNLFIKFSFLLLPGLKPAAGQRPYYLVNCAADFMLYVFCNCAWLFISLDKNCIFLAICLDCIKRPCHDLLAFCHSDSQIYFVAYIICLAVNHESPFAQVFSGFCFLAYLFGIYIKHSACLQPKLPRPAEGACCISSLFLCFLAYGPVFAFHDKKWRACHISVEHEVICLCMFLHNNLIGSGVPAADNQEPLGADKPPEFLVPLAFSLLELVLPGLLQ